MSIINQLSSKLKQKSEQGNRRVAAMVMNNPDLILEIVAGLQSNDGPLKGDCAEVCTMIAENNPELVAPYSYYLFPLLNHNNTRVRWEAMHAIALITPLIPDVIRKEWDQLADLFGQEKSVIVRDNIVICAGNLASSDSSNAQKVFPFLLDALLSYQTHHAKLALEGLMKGLVNLKSCWPEITEVADTFINHPKPSIKKAAKQLKKRLLEDEYLSK